MILNLPDLINKYNLDITGVIHVGAHVGGEYDVYKTINTIQNIVFFEPDRDSFDKLQKKINGDNNVTCINKALGPFTCEAFLHREKDNNGQSNSLLEPYVHTQQYPGIRFTEKEKVKVEPLDKYEPSSLLNFINMDVQGAELNVLLGATNTLRNNIKYVMTEVNRAELYKNCAMIEDIDYFLGKFGFKRVEVDWMGETWGDAFYIKA